MKKRRKVESKIPTTKTNTNRKKKSEADPTTQSMETSMFKKNEFTLIIFGALLLTLIVFFIFFRSPDKDTAPEGQAPGIPAVKAGQTASFDDIEKRIEQLEQMLIENKSGSKSIQGSDPIKARVARLESAFEVKFDSLIDRMGRIEKNLAQLKQAVAAPPVKAKKPAAAKAKPAPVKTAVKKTTKPAAKAPIFHTVLKGETLYSIGKKYNISVASLRKLNKLSETAKIYPGTNLMIR